MKKLLLYGLSLSLVFFLAACASKSAPSDADAATDAVQTDQSQNNEADDLTQAISNVQQSADKELEKRMIGAFYSVYYYSRELNPDKQVSDCLNYELRLLEDDFAFFKECGLEVPSDYEEDYKQWIADGCKIDGFEFYTQEELESEFNQVYSLFSSSDDDLGGELTELRHYCSLLGKLYPTDYVARYIDWRPLDASGKPASQLFTSVDELMYVTSTVNIRESYSVESTKLGTLSRGQSVNRVGKGISNSEADGWSKVILSDGSEVYVSSDCLSATKPSTSSGSTTSNGSTNNTPNGGTSGSAGQQRSSDGTSKADQGSGSSGKTDITQLPGYKDPSEFGEIIPFDPSTMFVDPADVEHSRNFGTWS